MQNKCKNIKMKYEDPLEIYINDDLRNNTFKSIKLNDIMITTAQDIIDWVDNEKLITNY